MGRIQSLLEHGLEQELYLGATAMVLRTDGTLIDSGSAGGAQETPAVPADPETVWDLASLTKPLATATSLLILAQQGALHLREDVTRYLPGTDGAVSSLQGITLRHLLSHSSGLKPWERFHSQELSREAILARVRSAERCRPVGTGYDYSDLGYILLGEVIQTVTGVSVAEFSRARVFEPLGMSHTRFLPPVEWQPRIAATRCPDRGRVLVGEVHDGNCAALGGIAGHAGLFGTMHDLARYARMLLAGGELEGTRVLSPLAARQMTRNQNPPGMNAHTLGWFAHPSGYLPAGDLLPEDTCGHTGFTGTSLLFTPSLGVAMILLTNRVYREADGGEFLRFRRRFHNAAAGLL